MFVINKKAIKVGSDPEAFLINKQNNSFVNAFNLYTSGAIKGTKKEPEKTKYGAIQIDGMAVELNTNPTDNAVEFSKLIREGLEDIAKRSGALISKESAQTFDYEFMLMQHPDSLALGCDPDFDAWNNGNANNISQDFIQFRTAGGHVHVGWTENADIEDKQHLLMCREVVKQLDYALGIWSISVDENGAKRRELYGKAGAFRPKSYGVEYRVLSNFWIFDPRHTMAVHKKTVQAVKLLADGRKFTDTYGEIARDLIMIGKKNTTQSILSSKIEKELETVAS